MDNQTILPPIHTWGGKRQGAGAKPITFQRKMSKAMTLAADQLPELVQALIDKALTGNTDAAIYLIDRVCGKPKQDMAIQGQILSVNTNLSPSQYALIIQGLNIQALPSGKQSDIPQPVDVIPLDTTQPNVVSDSTAIVPDVLPSDAPVLPAVAPSVPSDTIGVVPAVLDLSCQTDDQPSNPAPSTSNSPETGTPPAQSMPNTT